MKVWIQLAYQLIRRAVRNDLVWRLVEELVEQAETAAASGQRGAWVRSRLAALPEPYRTAVTGVAAWLMNFAIEAMVARLKVLAADSEARG